MKFHFSTIFVYVIVTSLTNYSRCSSPPKTFCVKPTDSECDIGWTPIPNLGAALVGYDLPTGNPFADDFIEDPGLRKQIFNATLPTENDSGGGFKLEPGLSARKYVMCDEKFVTHLATNVKSLKKVSMKSSTVGRGFDVGIEADTISDGQNFEGSLPSLVNIAWDVTDDTKNAATFFARTKGAIAIAEAQCITHKVDVSPFLTPHFHPSFVDVLRILEKQDTEVKQIRAFKGFVRDYGTHYLSSVYLGAKISAVTYFTAYERLKNGPRAIAECAALQASIKFEMANETSSDVVKCWTSENNDAELNGLSRTRLTSYGAKPNGKELSGWKDQEDILPIPIKFELTPIVNLFTVDNLDERYNITSKDILNWFLPLYLKYCKVLKYGCSPSTGCGYDDDCRFEDTCAPDRLAPKGYRCQATSWADIPNWPQMASPSGSQPVTHATAPEEKGESSSTESSDGSTNRRSDVETPSTSSSSESGSSQHDPEPANISWFRNQDYDVSGFLSLEELMVNHQDKTWFNQRYRTVMERLLAQADLNNDKAMDMNEFIRLHEKFPWYPEQLSFLLVNTDSNSYLSKQELIEASKASPDMVALQFNQKQLENLVDGVLAIGDKNGDKRITFDEYVLMSSDTFVVNFAPNNLKKLFRY